MPSDGGSREEWGTLGNAKSGSGWLDDLMSFAEPERLRTLLFEPNLATGVISEGKRGWQQGASNKLTARLQRARGRACTAHGPQQSWLGIGWFR